METLTRTKLKSVDRNNNSPIKIKVVNLNLKIGNKNILKDISVSIPKNNTWSIRLW